MEEKKEKKRYSYSVAANSTEEIEKIKKIIKVRAAQEGLRTYDLIIQAIEAYRNT